LTILEVTSLTKQFDGLQALNDVGFQVHADEILGIIGPNGAGKTTLFNTITGFHRPTRGKVIFNRRNVTGWKPNRIAGLGLIRTWQLVNLIGSQSTFENVRIACHLQNKVGVLQAALNTSAARNEEKIIRHQVTELLERVGLIEVKDETAQSLPHGLQRLLGICIALAAKPKVLLLDEPTAGMSGLETASMMEQIQSIRAEGVTVMLVEHDMKVIMSICDRILVFNFGRKIAEGTPQEVSKNDEVIRAYLGFENGNDQYVA